MVDFAEVKERASAALRTALEANDAPSLHIAPIQRALKPDGVVPIPEGGPGSATSELEKPVLELIFRKLQEELVSKSSMAGNTIESVRVPRLLDLAIELSSADVADPNTPFQLLEDLFDTQVISDAENLFGMLEKRASVIPVLLERATRAKLTLLRTTNELLRRLSKSKNTNFCGRILLLMAYVLPLAEKSGLNLKVRDALTSHLKADVSSGPTNQNPSFCHSSPIHQCAFVGSYSCLSCRVRRG